MGSSERETTGCIAHESGPTERVQKDAGKYCRPSHREPLSRREKNRQGLPRATIAIIFIISIIIRRTLVVIVMASQSRSIMSHACP